MEIFLFVVLGLVADVFADGVGLCRADAEFAVAALPCEVAIPCAFGFDPFGGARLHFFDDFGGGVVFGLGEEDVDVVGNGADLHEAAIVVPEDAGDVGVDLTACFVAE